MPRKPIDFSRTVIYKIVCNDLNISDCYVGHTINFIKRKNAHKTDCCNSNSPNYNLQLYQFIRVHGGFDNWSMIEIEKYPCTDVYEACKRERYWFEELKATLNKQVPSRTINEYKQENRELLRAKDKTYREENKESIRIAHKEYKAKNRESILAKN